MTKCKPRQISGNLPFSAIPKDYTRYCDRIIGNIIPGSGADVTWLLTNVLNLLATIGPDSVAGGTSVTQAREWNLSTGIQINQRAAGQEISEGSRWDGSGYVNNDGSGNKLQPSKTGENGEDIFLLYDYRQDSEVVSIGDHRYIQGTDNHNYALTVDSITTGTTGGSPPSISTSDIGNTKVDGGVTWRIDHYYSNLAGTTASTNYLPHILDAPAATNSGLHARDMTNAAWVKTTMTAAKDQTGFDGVANSASSLLATAGNATCLQTVTLGAADRITSADIKRISGTGTVEITIDNGTTWVDITSSLSTTGWYRAEATKNAANPVIGFRIVTDTDKIAVDYTGVEAGTVATSRMPTTTSTVTRAATSFTVPNPLSVDNIFQWRFRAVIQNNAVNTTTYFPFVGAFDSATDIFVVSYRKGVGFRLQAREDSGTLYTASVSATGVNSGDVVSVGVLYDSVADEMVLSIDGNISSTASTPNFNMTQNNFVIGIDGGNGAASGNTDLTINTDMSDADWYKETAWSDPE